MLVYWGFKLVGRVGFEPTTNGLKGRCSTTELPTHPIGAGTLIDDSAWRKREFARRPQKWPGLMLPPERETQAPRGHESTPISADREIGAPFSRLAGGGRVKKMRPRIKARRD